MVTYGTDFHVAKIQQIFEHTAKFLKKFKILKAATLMALMPLKPLRTLRQPLKVVRHISTMVAINSSDYTNYDNNKTPPPRF